MARRVSWLVLVFMTAIMVENPHPTVEAQQLAFSDDVTMDFATGGIDVSNIITQDFMKLPLAGNCGLAAKFVIPHVIDTSTSKGTLRTTFEYLTSQCTAEYNKETNSCSTLNLAFAACTGLALDQRISHRPWGSCTNSNFRVSYLWVPKATTNATPKPTPTIAPMTTMATRPSMTTTSLSSSSGNLLQSPVCWARGLGVASKNLTNPEALAAMPKDIPYLNRMAAKGAVMRASAVTGASCDWRFSNLVPVAWDGIQNVLSVGQSLHSADSRYMFIMQQDCNLVLYKKAADGSIDWQGKWATFTQYNDPFKYNCSMELQANGNLVVRDPQGNPRWETGATTSNLYSVSLAILSCGNVIVLDMTSGQIIWATHTGHS